MTETPPLVVISLPRAQERRAAISRRLDALGLNYEIFDGIDGKTLNPEEYAPRLNKEYWRRLRGRDLTAGEIGCFMSHYAVWELMAERGWECMIVLEDSCIIDPQFSETAQKVLESEWAWDVVLLSARKQYAVDRTLCELGGGRRLVRFRRRVGTTRAYMIRASAARSLIEYCREIRAPIDWLYAEWWENGLQFYAVIPALTNRDDVPSLIGRPPRARRNFSEWLWARKTLCLSFIKRHRRLSVAPQRRT
ncbi:MAG: glycosyltransferase family 25 protein [Gammaproteobacteria bacterium]